MLNINHLPSLYEEKIRIEKYGGRIEPCKCIFSFFCFIYIYKIFQEPGGEFVGPLRIWKMYEAIPGLMMSRTFGDQVGHSCGITDKPSIFEFPDFFFILKI